MIALFVDRDRDTCLGYIGQDALVLFFSFSFFVFFCSCPLVWCGFALCGEGGLVWGVGAVWACCSPAHTALYLVYFVMLITTVASLLSHALSSGRRPVRMYVLKKEEGVIMSRSRRIRFLVGMCTATRVLTVLHCTR